MGKMNYNLAKEIEREIISLAKRFGVKKVILFGSRARGTNRERSDIDLAVAGGDIFNFAQAVEEDIETLLTFDVVNLDEGLSKEFQGEIDRDGIILYKEASATTTGDRKFDSFIKCLAVLLESNKKTPDKIYRMGIIGQFNLTYDLSCKVLRKVLGIHGVSKAKTGTPREIIKAGYEFHFINDEKTWLDMLKRRDQTNLTYDEAFANKLVKLIFNKYIPAFVNLREELARRLSLENGQHDDSKQDQYYPERFDETKCCPEDELIAYL